MAKVKVNSTLFVGLERQRAERSDDEPNEQLSALANAELRPTTMLLKHGSSAFACCVVTLVCNRERCAGRPVGVAVVWPEKHNGRLDSSRAELPEQQRRRRRRQQLSWRRRTERRAGGALELETGSRVCGFPVVVLVVVVVL